MNKIPKEKDFKEGEIVVYSHPTKLMMSSFGKRVFIATSESSSLEEEYSLSGNNSIRTSPTDPPEQGHGLVMCLCFEPKHGSGTWYYKVLLGEHLFWIASEHLRKSKKRGKNV